MLAPQVGAGVGVGVVEQRRDLVQGEAEGPVEEDALEPVEVPVAVATVARGTRPEGESRPMAS